MFTFKVEGDILNMTSRSGQSYTAKLDGTEAPYKGDLVINAVSILRLGKDTFEETDKQDGKAIKVKTSNGSSRQQQDHEYDSYGQLTENRCPVRRG